MNEISIACIVEGHGDVAAIPILLHRIVREIDSSLRLYVPAPAIRVPRSSIVKPGEVERAVELAALKTNASGGILILVDADEDCPATLGPALLTRAKTARSDRPIAVVLAKQEYEAWFLAAAASLRGQQGLFETLEPPADPEGISGAKGWLRERMAPNRKYSETIDQPALTALFDLDAARQASSFDKLCRDVSFLVEQLRLPS